MHAFASGLITRFADGISITPKGAIREVEAQRYELEVLKQLTWYYVINRPASRLSSAANGSSCGPV